MLEVEFEGYMIIIGENQKENDTLVKTSDPDDYWVHISGYSSAHGIIKNPNNIEILRNNREMFMNEYKDYLKFLYKELDNKEINY